MSPWFFSLPPGKRGLIFVRRFVALPSPRLPPRKWEVPAGDLVGGKRRPQFGATSLRVLSLCHKLYSSGGSSSSLRREISRTRRLAPANATIKYRLALHASPLRENDFFSSPPPLPLSFFPTAFPGGEVGRGETARGEWYRSLYLARTHWRARSPLSLSGGRGRAGRKLHDNFSSIDPEV